jgi:hypothetical protein
MAALLFLTLITVAPVNAAIDSSPSVVWQKTYGRSDQIPRIIQTSDGGYLFLGLGWSHQMGYQQTALFKLDSNGNLTWSKDINASDLVQTYDGGYVVLQSTYSSFALAKFDKDNEIQWNHSYSPGYSQVYLRYLVKTTDGGYFVAGNNATGAGSYKFYGITAGSQRAASIIKIDSLGKIQWIENYNVNGTSDILAFEMSTLTATSDGGIAIGGTATMDSHDMNYCIVKINSQGDLEWVKTFGGTKDDVAYSLIQTSEGGYVIAGNSFSFNNVSIYTSIPKDDPSRRVDVLSTGGPQAWIVKTDSYGNMVWNHTYEPAVTSGVPDETYWTTAAFITQTSDGGLAFVGAYRSAESMWLVKMSIDGSLQWDKWFKQSYGMSGGTSVLETSDGSIIVAGFSQTMPDPWNSEFLLLKTSSVLPPPTPTPSPDPTVVSEIEPSANVSFDVWLPVVGFFVALFAILAFSILYYRRRKVRNIA